MQPRISVLTIGVADLDRSLAFYRDGLGLPTEGIVGREFEHGAVAFFNLSGGLKLAIWSQDDIVHDTELPKTPVSSTSFTIGHNVARREEVDKVMAEAETTSGKWCGIRPAFLPRNDHTPGTILRSRTAPPSRALSAA